MTIFENEIQVMQKLKDLDSDLDRFHAKEKLKERVNVILVGGAGLIIKCGLKRATGDKVIAPLTTRERMWSVGSLMASHGFHIVSEALLMLPS